MSVPKHPPLGNELVSSQPFFLGTRTKVLFLAHFPVAMVIDLKTVKSLGSRIRCAARAPAGAERQHCVECPGLTAAPEARQSLQLFGPTAVAAVDTDLTGRNKSSSVHSILCHAGPVSAKELTCCMFWPTA